MAAVSWIRMTFLVQRSILHCDFLGPEWIQCMVCEKVLSCAVDGAQRAETVIE